MHAPHSIVPFDTEKGAAAAAARVVVARVLKIAPAIHTASKIIILWLIDVTI